MWGFHLGEWCTEGYLPQNGRNIYFIAANNIWGNFVVLRTLFCHLGEIVIVFKWKKRQGIFLNCITKSYKLSGLNNVSLFVRSSVGQKSEHGVPGFSAQGLRRWNQSVSWAEFLPGTQGPLPRSHGCWENAVICGCITEVTDFFLTIGQGLFWALRLLTTFVTWLSPSSKAALANLSSQLSLTLRRAMSLLRIYLIRSLPFE